jgi:hypothetical protein
MTKKHDPEFESIEEKLLGYVASALFTIAVGIVIYMVYHFKPFGG